MKNPEKTSRSAAAPAPASFRYDAVHYPGGAQAQTHPDRLAVLGHLFGVKVASLENCRVLEIACGDGANLIPIAHRYPRSECVGIDLAAKPIAEGNAVIAQFGLPNIRLLAADVTQLPADLGRFDYIIAHGLYSWVPDAVRDGLLAACRRHLNAQGVAFISYNAFPGGHVRSMMREMMLLHVDSITEPQRRTRQAKAFVHMLGTAQEGQHEDAFRQLLLAECQRIEQTPDGVLFHDELSDHYQPVYFHQFARHAGAHGLQFLAEADFFEMQDMHLPEPVRQVLARMGGDLIRREQYLDFIRCRRFRQTLLCRQELPLQRDIDPKRMRDFHFATRASLQHHPDGNATLSAELGAALSTNSPPIIAAMSALADHWPQAFDYPSLLARSEAAGSGPNAAAELDNFLFAGYASGLLEAYLAPPLATRHPGERPRACDLAQGQLAQGSLITNLRHNTLSITDDIGRALLSLADGSRTRAELVAALQERVQRQELSLGENANAGTETTQQTLTRLVSTGIDKLAAAGVMVA